VALGHVGAGALVFGGGLAGVLIGSLHG
jgi:hypothetical protein